MSASPVVNHPIQVYTLGRFKLIIANQDQTALLSYDKSKLLLAIVALAPSSISRTQLAEMLWPELDNDKARSRLRHALFTVRQAFKAYPEALEITSSHVQLQSSLVFVDLFDFLALDPSLPATELKYKLDLYSAVFLQGLKTPSSDSYQNWHSAWQTRHELELAQHRHQLVSDYLDKNDIESALTYVKWWLLQTPEDESCHRYLIKLYLANGDRDAALRAYQHCAQILQERFNIEPSTETQSLLQQSFTPQNQLPSTLEQSSFAPSLRPVASLAIFLKINIATENLSLERGYEAHLDNLLYIQEKISQICLDYGAWFTPNQKSVLLAHFGYPTVRECPINQALDLALRLLQLSLPPQLSLHLALHASTLSFQNSSSLCLDTWIAQVLLPLVWQAPTNELHLTPQAAARLSHLPFQTVKKRSETVFFIEPQTLLNEKPSLPRIYGRLSYFDHLIQQWTRCSPGQPPVFAYIHGRSGMGKTQLATTFSDYVKNVRGKVIYLRNQEDKTHLPYHALSQWLTDILAPLDFQTERYSSYLKEQLGLSAETCQALLDQLFYQTAHSLSPARLHQTNQTVAQLFTELSYTKQPICLIWDDLQWLDIPSQHLLDHLQVHGTGLTLVLGLSRLPPTLSCFSSVQHLKPLSSGAITDFLADRAKLQKFSPEIKRFIVSTKINNPLYLNEILHLHSLGLSFQELPKVIDQLSAQLYSMNETQRNILFLSTLLDPLDEDLIQHILGLTIDSVRSALDYLCLHGLLQTEKQGIHNSEIGKKALLSLIPTSIKLSLCERIAHFFIQSEQPPALIANYLGLAQNPDSAAWWHKAIHSSIDQGQLEQAQAYTLQAILSQDYITDLSQRAVYAFNSHATLGALTVLTQGPSTPQTLDAYGIAAQHSHQDNALQQCTLFWSQRLTQHSSGHFAESLISAQRLREVALKANHDTWLGWSFYAQAQYHLFTANLTHCEKQLLQCITTMRTAKPSAQPLSFSDTLSYALAYSTLGLTQAYLGNQNPALQNAKHAILLAEQSHNPIALVACQLHLLRIYYLNNNLTTLKAESEKVLALFPKSEQQSVWFRIVQTYALYAQLIIQPSIEQLCVLQHIRSTITLNLPLALVGYLCVLARCHLALGQHHEAEQVLLEAHSHITQQNCVLLEPEIYLLQGDLWQQRQQPHLALEAWHQASALASERHLPIYTDWFKERVAPLTLNPSEH